MADRSGPGEDPCLERRGRGGRKLGTRVAVVAGLLALSVAGSLPLAPPASADSAGASDEATTVSFGAVADARVEEANGATNYGSATRLGSDGDAGLRIESYLRFALSDVRHTIRIAKLRVYVVGDGSVDGPSVYPSSDNWSEAGLTWATRPRATGAAVARTGPITAGAWVEVDVTSLVKGDGNVNLLLSQSGTDGASFYSRQGSYKPVLIVTSSDPVVMAAGDIACKTGDTVTAVRCRHGRTSDLLASEPWLTDVLMLGDGQYEDGLYSEYTAPGAYDETWGRAKAITKPVPGNHEFHTPGAPGYFEYFSSAAGSAPEGFYSVDLASWHLIGLNSEISTAAGSAQERWLRADLAATTKPCILAFWHRPRFSSGGHGSSASVGPLWQALHGARADIVLNGHDHDYERFAPQDPSGQATPEGIRQFVVGTGGASHSPFRSEITPNSEVRDSNTFGVVRLALHESSYDWTFVPEAGEAFSDSGSSACHASPPVTSVAASPSAGLAPLEVTADASTSVGGNRTPITSYSFSFGDGSPEVGPQQSALATHTYTVPGTYTLIARATDTAGQVGTAETQVVVKPNLARNSGFESGILGWNTSGSGPGITLTQGAGGMASKSAAQLTNTGGTPSSCVLNDSPNWVTTTLAGGYTGSLWVRADLPGARLKLRFREWSGTTLLGSVYTETTLTSSWQKAVVRYSPVSVGLSTLDFNAYVPNAPPGTCFYADDAILSPD